MVLQQFHRRFSSNRRVTTVIKTIYSRAASTSCPAYVDVAAVGSMYGHDQLAFADAVKVYHESERPVILRGAASHFKAIQAWQDWSYLLKTIGTEWLCDVEIGRYNQGQRVTVPFQNYMEYLTLWREKHNAKEVVDKEHLLYLAQNDLPEPLLSDIIIPSFCSDASYSVGHGKLYNVKIWMGPAGCLSPLHFDPLDNVLMQINGTKKVWLINKNVDSQLLYCGREFNQQNNTSAVEDIESPDTVNFPNLQNVPEIQTGILHPGDIMFIPSKWWHSLKSLDFSISVNAWWR